MASNSDKQNTLNSLNSQLEAINKALNDSYSTNLGNLPKVNYLLDWSSVPFGSSFLQRQDNTAILLVSRLPISSTGGANGVLNWLLGRYRYYNDLYNKKKERPLKKINDTWLGNENVSKSQLRQCQEFFLTAYNEWLKIVQDLLNKKKSIVKDIAILETELSLISTATEHLSDIAENEAQIMTANAETRVAKAKITARNLAIYGLPLIALVVLGYFIYIRKIKL